MTEAACNEILRNYRIVCKTASNNALYDVPHNGLNYQFSVMKSNILRINAQGSSQLGFLQKLDVDIANCISGRTKYQKTCAEYQYRTADEELKHCHVITKFQELRLIVLDKLLEISHTLQSREEVRCWLNKLIVNLEKLGRAVMLEQEAREHMLDERKRREAKEIADNRANHAHTIAYVRDLKQRMRSIQMAHAIQL